MVSPSKQILSQQRKSAFFLFVRLRLLLCFSVDSFIFRSYVVFFYVCDSHYDQRVRQINITNTDKHSQKHINMHTHTQRRIWHWHNYRVVSFRCMCFFIFHRGVIWWFQCYFTTQSYCVIISVCQWTSFVPFLVFVWMCTRYICSRL